MNIPPPPQTDSLQELREWCYRLWQELQFPQWETIRLIPRTVPTAGDQIAEGTIYQDSAGHVLKARNASGFTDCNT